MLKNAATTMLGVLAATGLVITPTLAAGGWSTVPLPPTGQNASTIGVHATSDTDAWAVGSVPSATTGVAARPLIDHWNGSGWTQVTAPTFPTSQGVHLLAVDAGGTGDAWTVGYTQFNRHTITPVALHWNGSAWTTGPTPMPGSTVPSGVADLGPGNAYAIGNNSPLAAGILAHWDGSTWTRITYPDPNPSQPGMNTYLNAITALSPTDVWAVGEYLLQTAPNTLRYETFALHFDGSTWSVVHMPLVPGTDPLNDYLFGGLTAISGNDVWAVGESGDNIATGGYTPAATVTEHWNGTAWTVVPSPTPGSAPRLDGVTARSTTDVWAAGSYVPASTTQPLTLHWDGTSWTTVATPSTDGRLTAVSTRPGSSLIWAIGYTGTTGSLNPLALQHP